jgi:Zn-dependent protease with chaperone function
VLGRSGAAAVIFRPWLKQAHPDLARFITAHESAHLARADTMTIALNIAAVAGVAATAMIGDPAALWLTVPVLATIMWWNWRRELACDRFAAQAAGGPPARAFIAYLNRVDDLIHRRSRLRRWADRCRSRFTHPPARLRRAAIIKTLNQTREHAEDPAGTLANQPDWPAGEPGSP